MTAPDSTTTASVREMPVPPMPADGNSPGRTVSERYLSDTGRRISAAARELFPLMREQSTASLNNPIQRFVRDSRVLNSHGALRLDPQAEITGRRLLGLKPFMMMGGGRVPDVSAQPDASAQPSAQPDASGR